MIMTEIATTTTEPTAAEEVTAAQVAAGEPAPEDAAADGEPDVQQSKKPGVRQRITDLEGERDALTAKLEAAHAQAFDGAVQAMGLKPALLRAAGLNVVDYVREDGTVDTEALTVAADGKRAELGLSRRPLPNSVAGVNNGVQSPERRTLGEVLKSVVRPS
jgi:hypothetical protein